MKIALIIIGGLAVLVIAFLIWRYIATILASQRLYDTLLREVNPIIERLEGGDRVSVDAIEALARKPETRSLMYRRLCQIGKAGLFPAGEKAAEKIAESDLVVWLLHPNELDAVPDDIELVKVVEREDESPSKKYRFYIFKYRTNAPHWAADHGWLAGMAGPYWDGEESDFPPPGVFSRFEDFASRTPEEHLEITEELLLRKLK